MKQKNKMTADNPQRPIALITGGSRGIGLALAREFARHGYDLILVARSETALKNAVEKVERESQVNVTTYALDLSSPDAPHALLDKVQRDELMPEVLVNNAGIGDSGPFAASDPERLMTMLQLNMLSLTALTRLFLPGMLERGRGRILNVASLVAYFAAGPGWVSYVASKHYVLAFTRGLARELNGTGVAATALCPGTTATDFVVRADVTTARAYRWLPKVTVDNVARVGYRGTMKGKTTVVPGLLNKCFAFLGELHPRGIALRVFTFLSRKS